MNNLQSYKRTWASHREAVKAIRAEHDKTTEGLRVHQGSEFGEGQQAIADARFRDALQAERIRFESDMNGVLSKMKEAIPANSIEAPSTEQLALIQAVSHFKTMSVRDFEQYAERMDGNAVALRALHDVCADKVPTGTVLPMPVSRAEKTRRQLAELRESARIFAEWDGTTHGEAMSAFHAKSVSANGTNTPKPSMPYSVKASTIDPTAKDYWQQVIGTQYSQDELMMLD